MNKVTTPNISLLHTTGKPKAPCSPISEAILTRWKFAFSITLVIQKGLQFAQIQPGIPTPSEKLICLAIASNSRTSNSGKCQVSRQRSRFVCRSTLQNSPSCHLKLSHIAWSIFGVASLKVAESANIRVTACCAVKRCSVHLRSVISMPLPIIYSTSPSSSSRVVLDQAISRRLLSFVTQKFSCSFGKCPA